VVGTLGLLVAVSMAAAGVQDRDGAAPVVAQACAKVCGLKKLYADAAYGDQCAMALENTHGITVEIVRHPGNRVTGSFAQDQQQPLWPEATPKGFVVQAKRWVEERTHAWNKRARRLIAHHDRPNWAPLAWVRLAEARILATRLAA
jgi:putative transposase